jgi:hypothetical protein
MAAFRGAFWMGRKHLVSFWRWVSVKKMPLGVSLWGKSVYTSFCVEQGLTLKGLPSSRDATAFSPLAAASKKEERRTLSPPDDASSFKSPGQETFAQASA